MNDTILTFDPFPPARDPQPDHIHILGFEFDGTACYRKGTRLGPDAIRQASRNIETYSPYLKFDTSDVRALDLGNLPLGESSDVEANWEAANQAFRKLADQLPPGTQRGRFLLLGGEHSVSYQPIVNCLKNYPDLLLVQLDAHADLRDGYQSFHYSHASLIRRVVDHFASGHQLLQQGIRSGTREEFDWMREKGSLMEDVTFLRRALERVPDSRPIYLTLDLDYFDPAAMPGTGTPEPGGGWFDNFIEILQILAGKRLVGADVVELAPNLDDSGISEVLAAKCVRELAIALHLGLHNTTREEDS